MATLRSNLVTNQGFSQPNSPRADQSHLIRTRHYHPGTPRVLCQGTGTEINACHNPHLLLVRHEVISANIAPLLPLNPHFSLSEMTTPIQFLHSLLYSHHSNTLSDVFWFSFLKNFLILLLFFICYKACVLIREGQRESEQVSHQVWARTVVGHERV